MKLLTMLLTGLLMVAGAKAQDTVEVQLKNRCDELANKAYPTPADADVKIAMAEDYYFYGSRCVSTDSEKMDWHSKGLEAAVEAATLLSGTGNSEALGAAHYYSAVNLSKWGLANGLLASFGRWGEVEDFLEVLLQTDAEAFDYGVYRVWGRGEYKHPFGSYDKSEEYLREAYTKTLHPELGTSINLLNTLYYLDTLREQENDDEFCTVYDDFSTLMPFTQEKANQLNPERALENLLDMKMFDNPPRDEDWIEDVKDYADINC